MAGHYSSTFETWKGKRSSLGYIKIWGCEIFIRREAQDKLEAIFEKCLFIGYPEELFGYLFYKPKDNVVFVARRGVFLERDIISKEDSGSKIDLEEIKESTDEEPIVNTDTQQEVVTLVKPDDISLPIHRTSGRVNKPPQFYYGFHIKEDKIIDSTLSEFDEPANYMEAMASPEAAKRWDVSGSSRRRQTWMRKYTLIKLGCDAIWQTYKDDSRSQLDWVFLLNGGAMTWKRSKKDTVADSTCESEYIAACETSKEAI
ncbi:retrotransposon protein, putative, ty1-copia subclass [Tanacetum coccineum]